MDKVRNKKFDFEDYYLQVSHFSIRLIFFFFTNMF